jgi:tRNA (cmo5U34)-methyltransferase
MFGLANESEWTTAKHSLRYLDLADRIPHRGEGEAALLEQLHSHRARHILDLGTGNGRLLALLRQALPEAEGVGLDISPTLLQAARERFADEKRVHLESHDLNDELPELGRFDVVVSSLAIHHVPDRRKRSLYREIFECLEPGGAFFNLEHVTPGSPALHSQYLAAIGLSPGDEDPSNQLAPVETQVRWLREIGFLNVDCYWKWLELALLGGTKDRATTNPAARG